MGQVLTPSLAPQKERCEAPEFQNGVSEAPVGRLLAAVQVQIRPPKAIESRCCALPDSGSHGWVDLDNIHNNILCKQKHMRQITGKTVFVWHCAIVGVLGRAQAGGQRRQEPQQLSLCSSADQCQSAKLPAHYHRSQDSTCTQDGQSCAEGGRAHL
jgi:hypothetical protein